MFSFLSILNAELLYLIKNKKKYYFQSLIKYIERIIFFVGMLLLLTNSSHALLLTFVIKAIFWFILINGFYEVALRIESEIRLKQFTKCFNLKTSYWLIMFCRMILIFIESLFMALLSIVIIMPFVKIIFDISLFNVLVYICLMLFQYFVFLYLFAFVAIYFKRVLAVMDLVESYSFFYAGIVLTSSSYSLFIFVIINNIMAGEYKLIWVLILIMLFEVLIIRIGAKFISGHIRK